MTTVAIAVGVSRYDSPLYGDLPAAAADARRVEQALTAWGVIPDNIAILLDEQATRKAILNTLRVWTLQRAARDLRLIFFFAGHGARIQESGRPAASALLTYDSDPADRLGTGITLSDLMGALARIRPKEAYLFLDACALRIDQVDNVLPDADVLTTTRSSCLLCMVASGTSPAFESVTTRSGHFTDSILRNLAVLRPTAATSADLIRAVEIDLARRGLPAPETYLIGSFGWPLPREPEKADPKPEGVASSYVPRNDSLALLRDAIVTASAESIWLYDESGSGKTVLARQLCRGSSNSVYSSLPPPGDDAGSDSSVYLAGDIAEQLPHLFPSGRPEVGEPRRTFEVVAARMAGATIAVDHLERATPEGQLALIQALAFPSINVVFIARVLPPPGCSIRVVPCPRLSPDEIHLFAEQYAPNVPLSVDFLSAASRGGVLRLMDFLFDQSNPDAGSSLGALMPAMAKVVAAGGYVDEPLFRQIFGVDARDLARLQALGLLTISGDHVVPHDALIEMRPDRSVPIDTSLVLRHWKEQVNTTPYHLWSCRMLVASCVSLDPTPDVDDALCKAIETIAQVRDWEAIETVAECMTSPNGVTMKAAVLSAEQLVQVQRFWIVDRILDVHRSYNLDIITRARLCLVESERQWWYGNFSTAIRIATEVLQTHPGYELCAAAHVHVGIGHFFIGEWGEAVGHLMQANDPTKANPRTVGWARLILATILGLRGVEIARGRELFYSSIRLLSQVGDDAGLAVAWGNFGEMSWKLRDYRSSLVQLITGYDLAESMGGSSLKIEIARNLVHLQLRLAGEHSADLRRAVDDVRALFDEAMGPTVQMQLWNTIGTVAAYRCDTRGLREAVCRAKRYTRGNDEYHIYTLANSALALALRGKSRAATTRIVQALDLAGDGNNYLAIVQILDDVKCVHEKCGGAALASLLGEARAWLAQFNSRAGSIGLEWFDLLPWSE